MFHARTADPRDDFLHELNGFLQILAGHGERHVGHAFAAGGLDDHVNHDAVFGQRRKKGGGDAGAVRNPA